MKRIVVVGQDPGFGGGAVTMANRFVDGARSLGHEVALVYLPHPSFSPRASGVDRVEALRLVRGRLVIPPADEVWVVAGVASHGYTALKSGRPYSCWIATSLTDENRGRVPGLPHARRLAAYVNAPVLRRLERRVLRGAKRVFGISEASRHSLVAASGLPPDRVGSLPVPVNLQPEEPAEKSSAPVISFVARGDDPRKNLDLALAAFELVRREEPDARLRVIGPPPSRSLPSGVETTGLVNSVSYAVRDTNVFLLTSHQEGFAIVAAEALSVGVPVVSTPSGGPEAMLLDSGAGVITDGWLPREVADAVLDLLRDPVRLSTMGRLGVEYTRREHTPTRFAERLQGILLG
jgi:phosphatidylinositol alpha-1,6-mannosyltransferase